MTVPPERESNRIAWLILGGALLVRLPFAALLPMAGDEAYFALWGRHLDWSYYDHPPMIAFFVRAGTALLDETALGIRLAGLLAMTAAGWWLYRAAFLMFGARVALAALVWWQATLFAAAFSITATPDTPLLVFWTLGLYALARVARGERRAWLLFGLALGLALLSKYTALLMGIGAALWVLISPRQRRWLRDPMLYLGAALAFALFAPVIAWNAAHEWISFAFQAARTGDSAPRTLSFTLEHIAAQTGLATPLIALAVGITLYVASWRGVRGDDRFMLLACLAVPTSVLFGVVALEARVQGNWPAPLYLAGIIAACAWLAEWRGRWPLVAPAALGFTIVGVVLLHLATGLLPLRAEVDPRLRLEDWRAIAAQVADTARRENAAYVLTSDYRVTGYLGLALGRDIPVIQFHQRPRFTYERDPLAGLAGRDGLMVEAYSACRITVEQCCAAAVEELAQIERPAPQRVVIIARVRGLRALMPPAHDSPQGQCRIP